MDLLTVIIVMFVVGVGFSAIETAFTAFDRILIDGWKKSRKRGISFLEYLAAHPDRFLSTTLIGNNLSNVAFTAALVAYCEGLGLSEVNTTLVSAASSVVVLVFSEILPKQVAYSTANRIVRAASVPLMMSYVLFAPIRWILSPLFKLSARTQRGDPGDRDDPLLQYQSEIEHVLAGAEATGAVNAEEGEILNRFLDARDLKVRQIMTPRTKMIAAEVDEPVDKVRELLQKHHIKRLPVYQETVDHVIGYVRARDFLWEPENLRSIIRPIQAVPESKYLTELLEEFRTSHERIAIVIDEYGGTDGLVTLTDIFHELVGPVAEHWEGNKTVIKRTAPGKYLVSGASFLEQIEQETGWEAPESEVNTLSGLLAEEVGRIPNAGEEIVIGDATFRVIRRSPKQIEGCLMKMHRNVEDRDD